ncbi:nuclear transport factor 2 family protein [Flavitalea sp.]|nr:nuclear transport factor 2 family protein [Flavitalea sp.]
MNYRILFIASMLTCNLSYSQDNTNLEKTIRMLEQKVIQGILDNDTLELKKLWAPEFMVNTPRNNVAPNRDSVFKIQLAGMIDYKSFERKIEQIQFQDNIVITMGSEVYVPKNDLSGAKAGQTVNRRFTNIWKNNNGNWQQIARHASVICK